jgi:hypothetical protein
MLCKTCNISDICKVKEYLNSNSHIVGANITWCKHSSNSLPAPATTTIPVPAIEPQALGLGGRPRRDYSQESLIASGVDPKKDFKLITADNGEEPTPLIDCPTCGGKTPIDALSECGCGVTICGCCTTSDGDTGRKYCPECWSKLT